MWWGTKQAVGYKKPGVHFSERVHPRGENKLSPLGFVGISAVIDPVYCIELCPQLVLWLCGIIHRAAWNHQRGAFILAALALADTDPRKEKMGWSDQISSELWADGKLRSSGIDRLLCSGQETSVSDSCPGARIAASGQVALEQFSAEKWIVVLLSPNQLEWCFSTMVTTLTITKTWCLMMETAQLPCSSRTDRSLQTRVGFTFSAAEYNRDP